MFYSSYVPNPVKTLAELKQKGEVIETVAAEIVAGDAGDLNVISIKGSSTIFKFILNVLWGINEGKYFLYSNNISFHKQKKLKLKMTQMQSTTGSGVLGCVKRIKIAQMGHFAFCGNQTINVAKNLTKKVFTQIFLILSNRNNFISTNQKQI